MFLFLTSDNFKILQHLKGGKTFLHRIHCKICRLSIPNINHLPRRESSLQSLGPQPQDYVSISKHSLYLPIFQQAALLSTFSSKSENGLKLGCDSIIHSRTPRWQSPTVDLCHLPWCERPAHSVRANWIKVTSLRAWDFTESCVYFWHLLKHSFKMWRTLGHNSPNLSIQVRLTCNCHCYATNMWPAYLDAFSKQEHLAVLLTSYKILK